MDNLSLLANLPNHVNGKHLNVYRWLDGCGWSLKGSREKIIQKVESDYFY